MPAPYTYPGANPWQFGYPGTTTAPQPSGGGIYTYGLAASPVPIGGPTNYFLNGMPIAGADIASALDAIKTKGTGTGSITPGGFNFNTGTLQGTPASSGLPDYEGMLEWLMRGQGKMSFEAPQGPTWP